MGYSQNSEDSFITFFFKNQPTGKFIDVGAYHPTRFSNVRALYEAGWKGVMVEPSRPNYEYIAEFYEEDKEIIVLNFAIGATNEEIDFYDSDGDAISTSDEEHMKKWGAAGVNYTKIKVQQVSVVDFMEQYGRGTDFLSIDTEATNMVVFRNMPTWVWEEIKCLCIEHDQCQEEIEETLLPYGFKTLYINAENIILSKDA